MIGRELVATIQAMLVVDSRNVEASLTRELAESAASELRPFGLDRRSEELFSLFRKTDVENMRENMRNSSKDVPTKAATFASVVAATKGWHERLHELDAIHLYESNEWLYGELKPKLHAARNRATHVGAVLRPFSRRYLERWEAAKLNEQDFDAARARIAELESQEISTAVDLQSWARTVYEDIFLELAVVKAEAKNSSASGESNFVHRPIGAIRQSSERTYRQQWYFWIKENETRLLQKGSESSEVARNSLTTMPPGFWGPPPTLGTFSTQTEIGLPQHIRSPWVTIKLFDQADPNVKSERSWFDKSAALSELPTWLKTVGLIWGSEKRSAIATVEFLSSTGNSKFTLPLHPLDELDTAIRPLVESIPQT